MKERYLELTQIHASHIAQKGIAPRDVSPCIDIFFQYIVKQLDTMSNQSNSVDDPLDSVDDSFDSVDDPLDSVDDSFDSVDDPIDSVGGNKPVAQQKNKRGWQEVAQQVRLSMETLSLFDEFEKVSRHMQAENNWCHQTHTYFSRQLVHSDVDAIGRVVDGLKEISFEAADNNNKIRYGSLVVSISNRPSTVHGLLAEYRHYIDDPQRKFGLLLCLQQQGLELFGTHCQKDTLYHCFLGSTRWEKLEACAHLLDVFSTCLKQIPTRNTLIPHPHFESTVSAHKYLLDDDQYLTNHFCILDDSLPQKWFVKTYYQRPKHHKALYMINDARSVYDDVIKILKPHYMQFAWSTEPNLKSISKSVKILQGSCTGTFFFIMPYIKPKRIQTLAEFLSLCRQVERIHEKNIVHGDIHLDNVLSLNNECEALLIDFDIAGIQDQDRYPPSWNTHLFERHPNSLPNHFLHRSHDVFSLQRIAVTLFQGYTFSMFQPVQGPHDVAFQVSNYIYNNKLATNSAIAN